MRTNTSKTSEAWGQMYEGNTRSNSKRKRGTVIPLLGEGYPVRPEGYCLATHYYLAKPTIVGKPSYLCELLSII